MAVIITNPSPLVSIIMPLYNKRPYVKRAVASIQNQSYKNWELIVVDDGSSDGSGDEIPLEDRRIRIYRQSNSGPSAARNHGIKRASGEFYAFIDADDWYYPNKLENEINLIGAQNRPDWMVSAYDYQQGENFFFRSFFRINGNILKGKALYVDDALKKLKVQGWPVDGLFIKRSLFQRIGGFKEEMHYGEITEFIIRCALQSPQVAVFPGPLYRVVKTPGSLSEKISKKKESIQCFIEILYNFSKKHVNYENELLIMAEESLRTFIGMLILEGKRKQVKNYLKKYCPLPKSNFSFRLFLLPYIPRKILKYYYNLKSHRRF